MRIPQLLSTTALVGALLCGVSASAATVSGTVTNTSNAPLQNMEVRAWQLVNKQYVAVAGATTDANGAYTLTNLVDGDYKINARMGPGVGGNYGDRWYDVAPPSSNGYQSADADIFTLALTDALTGIDFQLEVLGGFDGHVKVGTTLTPGILIRGEQGGQPRIQHTDLSQGGFHPGEFNLRGMVPSTDYRFFARDPDAKFETLVAEPFTCTSNTNLALPDFILTAIAPDPGEPNNDFTATNIDISPLHASPPGTFASTGAHISPRNTGDTDWYCFAAVDGDRFFITADSTLSVASGTRSDPWMDPVIGLFDGTGTTKLGENDDDAAGNTRASKLDTGVLTAGRYCAVVTTFGDTTYVGQNQGSAGRYGLKIVMGNRKPTIAASVGGMPAPVPPATVTIDEGQSVSIDVTYSDPDGDPLAPTAVMKDSQGNVVSTGTWVPGPTAGTFSWSADQVAAKLAPYTVEFTAADAEFTQTVDVVIAVNSVNLTPTVPTQVSPADMSTVMTVTPALVIANATDGDNDPLTYEFELYYGNDTTPAQTQSVPEDPTGMGMTSWMAAAIPENTHARWRVRAFDGQTDSPYSAWTGEWTFFVDAVNDPPEAPVFLKPDDSEMLMNRKPTLSASNPVDPEGDAVSIVFQVASDNAFTKDLVESPAIPVAAMSSSTMWTMPNDLPWGSTWFARAYAKDSRGGVSPMSNFHVFSIRANIAPSVPVLGAPFNAQCQNLVINDSKLASVTVLASTDPENEPVTIQLRVLPGMGDPATVTALYDQTVPQTGTDGTVFDTSGVALEEDAHYRVQARGYDGTDYSEWSTCDFTIDAQQAPAGGNDGGTGNGGGDGGNGGGTGNTKPGCGCGAGPGGSAMALFGVLAFGAFAIRRRRAA